MFNVTLRRMEVLVTIAEEGSFAAAADRFGIAQSSVSAHVRALERSVGSRIFDRRRGRKPVLTEIGRSVLENAREMLAQAERMRADVVNISASFAPRVVLSCQRSVGNFVLRREITEFATRHPEIQLAIRLGKQEEVFDEVRSGSADVGCYIGNEEIRGVPSEVIGTAKLVIVASPNHPLAGRRRIKPGEIQKYGFVTPPPTSLFGRALSRLLADAGLPRVTTAAQATEYQFQRELIAAGIGIACALEKSVEADVRSGLITVLDFEGRGLMFQIRQFASPNRPLTEEAAKLMRFLREHRATPADGLSN